MLMPRWFIVRSRNEWIGILIGLFIGLSVLMMMGCQMQTPPSSERSPLEASLTEPCPSLTPLVDGLGASVLRKLIDVSQMYYECSRRHRALVEATK